MLNNRIYIHLKKYLMKKIMLSLFLLVAIKTMAQNSTDVKMNLFVTALMKKMTTPEKIGQLNLLTPGGGILTGAVVSSDVEKKIIDGNVGGLFGVTGVEKIKVLFFTHLTKHYVLTIVAVRIHVC